MKWVKRKNVEADMEDVGLFFGKNKGRAGKVKSKCEKN